MKNIFLHIGTFRTGTTSIQSYLRENMSQLEQQGFLYPFPLNFNRIDHHELPLSMIKKYTNFRAPGWPQFDESMEYCWDRIFNQIEVSDCNNIIISSECFCDLVNESSLHMKSVFSEVLIKYFSKYNVKVICYVRDISKYIISRYGETLKISSLNSSLKFEAEAFFANDSIHINPLVYLDFFSSIFGENALIVRQYDKAKLRKGDVVCDFLNLLGLQDNFSKIYQKNRSISIQDFLLKRLINLSGFQDSEFNLMISDLLIRSHEVLNSSQEEVFDNDLLMRINNVHKILNDRYSTDFKNYESLSNVKEGDGKELLPYFTLSLVSLLLKQNREILEMLSDLKNK